MNPLSFLVILLTAIPALAAGAHFPSASPSRSPDRRWKLICEKPQKSEWGYLLVLENIRGRRFELWRFDHSCDTLWSPNSSQIAVTDELTSDMSDVFVYSVDHPRSGRSIAKLFPRTAIPKQERNGHCYFEATKWLDDHHLGVKVSGHRDEAPTSNFEYEFIYDLMSGSFERK